MKTFYFFLNQLFYAEYLILVGLVVGYMKSKEFLQTNGIEFNELF